MFLNDSLIAYASISVYGEHLSNCCFVRFQYIIDEFPREKVILILKKKNWLYM